MKRRSFVKTLTAIAASLSAIGQGSGARTLKQAWAAWTNGEIATAKSLAQGHLERGEAPDEARHLLAFAHFAEGKYQEAIAQYAAISPSYGSLKALREPLLDAYLHLGRYADALDFARTDSATPAWMTTMLERAVSNPFEARISGLTEMPFADHELTPYFPAFSIDIEGQSTVAHVDTGGDFLFMGPDRAKALGIQTIPADVGAFHLNLSNHQTHAGIASRLVLGGVTYRNVPVTVLPTLAGQSDFIIFGTRLLQPFLATLDYPRHRLLLSPRYDSAATVKHLASLPPPRVRVPFYLWGTHFMFAKGSFGPHNGLTFFVDSGLLSLQADANGEMVQAAFTTSKKNFERWGISAAGFRKPLIPSPEAIGLGPLEQKGLYLVEGQAGDTNFGGVRIDGLISHAFLKRYTWTLDFDAREFIFSSEA